ncbi:Arc family DNA-binding protein [Euzebya rosea]|uniref:Arc family DNA-binding protein n=1 Tax=Euzebya rosea TaxID=2052804 RepID=UPI000D3E05F5|nr:Arc family DNA-binding protein [Euzebya rosea]
MAAPKRKQFPLRIPQELYDVYESWAGDEFRSVNAQIEAVLVDAARRSGRLRRRRPADTERADVDVDPER